MARELAHELSWSTSRLATFRECRRRYYFDYYLSWRGWERQAPADRRQVYLLKKMTRMPALCGDALHLALAAWFADRARGRTAREAEILELALARLRDGYRESREGAWKERPSRAVHLAEHHYREPEVDEESGRAASYGKRFVERLRTAVGAFFASPELAGARGADPEAYLALEDMGTIEIAETRVFAIPDFACRDDAGRVWIYDWKSGSPRELDAFQLAVYVLYAEQVFDAQPEEVACVAAYLTKGEVSKKLFGPRAIASLRVRVEESIAEMRALHFDADEGDGERDAFPLTSELRLCSTCNYREVCGREVCG